MKHISTFENFVNENLFGKSWDDFTPEEIANAFMKDHPQKPNVKSSDLDQWIEQYAKTNKIEAGTLEKMWLDSVITLLGKEGYKNIDIEDISQWADYQ